MSGERLTDEQRANLVQHAAEADRLGVDALAKGVRAALAEIEALREQRDEARALRARVLKRRPEHLEGGALEQWYAEEIADSHDYGAALERRVAELEGALSDAHGKMRRAMNALESDADLNQRREAFEAIQDHFDPPELGGYGLAISGQSLGWRSPEEVRALLVEAAKAGAGEIGSGAITTAFAEQVADRLLGGATGDAP